MTSWPKDKTILRTGFYLSGLLMLTLGIALTIVANLGTSPFDALLVGLYDTFGLTVGSWEYILGAILLIINALILRRKPDVLAMLTAVITGIGIDFWLFILSLFPEPDFLWVQLIMLVLGILFVGLGIATYLQADFAPSPLDATMLLVQQKFGVKLSTAKNLLMFVFLLLALVFNGPIALGTLVMLIAGGPSITAFMPMVQGYKSKLIAGSTAKLKTPGLSD